MATAAPPRPAAARPSPERHRKPLTLRVAGLVAILLVAGFLAALAQVLLAARGDALPARADAIVVLGAAQYDGRPSPVFAARLDHAADLHADGVAPVVLVTGSRKPGDRFSEASAAAGYLSGRGVPEDAIRREVTGRNSWESLAASTRVLRNELGSVEVVLVSDPLHAARIGAIAEEVGLNASVSPTPASRYTGVARVQMAVREAVGVGAGQLIGFRRLTNLQGTLRAEGETDEMTN